MASMQADAENLTEALLTARKPGATICPSEVARHLAVAHGLSGWRELMPTIHAAIDALTAKGAVSLTWKGTALASRAGPYRIRRARL